MVVLTAGALCLFDCHTRMRVHPSSGGKGAVWLDWNVLSCEFRRSSWSSGPRLAPRHETSAARSATASPILALQVVPRPMSALSVHAARFCPDHGAGLSPCVRNNIREATSQARPSRQHAEHAVRRNRTRSAAASLAPSAVTARSTAGGIGHQKCVADRVSPATSGSSTSTRERGVGRAARRLPLALARFHSPPPGSHSPFPTGRLGLFFLPKCHSALYTGDSAHEETRGTDWVPGAATRSGECVGPRGATR